MPYRSSRGKNEIASSIISLAPKHRHALGPVSSDVSCPECAREHGHFSGFVFLPRESDAVPTHGFCHPMLRLSFGIRLGSPEQETPDTTCPLYELCGPS
jgi:hypothetical protein